MRLGTRASPLALAQAALVANGLRSAGADVETVPMRTQGDRRFGADLTAVGGKGLFVRDLEEALLAGTIDAAVHSLKDLPAELPPGLRLASFLPREDPRDVLVTRTRASLESLPKSAVIGTSSPRRRAQVLAIRPDLIIEPIRGNVDTRLRKLERGEFDALLLAAAGLHRLGLWPEHAEPLPLADFLPAVGQGILAIEIRSGDRRARALAEMLNHADTAVCAVAERAYLGWLGASCNTAIAGHSTVEGERIDIAGIVATEDGRTLLRGQVSGRRAEAGAVGRRLAESLLDQGAAALAPLHPNSNATTRGEQ